MADLDGAIVRIFVGSGPEVAGLGILLPGRRVLTCLHVVSDALGLQRSAPVPVHSQVTVDFPLVAPCSYATARVEIALPTREPHPGDLAILTFSPADAADRKVAKRQGFAEYDRLTGLPVQAIGFPVGHQVRGIWAKGNIGNPVAGGYLQLECRYADGNVIRPGFSGSPVINQERTAVLGMITNADAATGTALMLSVEALRAAIPGLLAAAPSLRPRVAREAAPLGKLAGVPPLPPGYVPRADSLADLKRMVLQDLGKSLSITALGQVGVQQELGKTVSLTDLGQVGLQGRGGIGKSVLAAALARDDDVRRQFPDGVVWLTFGQSPDVLNRQRQLCAALGGDLTLCLDMQAARAQLQAALQDKACLVILDDAWQFEHVRWFHGIAGPWGRLLVTTRKADVVRAMGATNMALDVLADPQARELLARSAGVVVGDLPANN